jgi:membrane protein
MQDEFGLAASGWSVFFAVIKWLFIILLFFSTISLIYYYGPSQKIKKRFITPGASFATLLSIIASLAFGFFVNNFGVYNQIYGSIGTLIVLMLWININSLVLLVGFEINNSVEVNKDLKIREEEE